MGPFKASPAYYDFPLKGELFTILYHVIDLYTAVSPMVTMVLGEGPAAQVRSIQRDKEKRRTNEMDAKRHHRNPEYAHIRICTYISLPPNTGLSCAAECEHPILRAATRPSLITCRRSGVRY